LEVGQILRKSGILTIEFRASIIIGSGSLSFDMVRALVERLPVMITPRWVRSLAQPIAVEDVIEYLLEAVDLPLEESKIFEIGGKDRVSYEGIMQEYARQRNLRRIMIPVPLFSPKAASYWLALVTPLYFRVGRKLVASVKNDSIVENDSALRAFSVEPKGLAEAISRAIRNEDQQFAATHWSDALSESYTKPHPWGVGFGHRRVDSYSEVLDYPPSEVFIPIQCLGGKDGWYTHRWLWWTRGTLDSWLGGVGLRRGRRDPYDLRVGDAIDFWRVEKLIPNRLLLLFAEIKLPGRAWTFFEVSPHGKGSELRITAVYDPKGIWGRLHWYLVSPFHYLVFKSMIRGIARAVERNRKEAMTG
ncbi:MAG: SDR family oxidoreductase, partial [Pseudomonadota bacterium]